MGSDQIIKAGVTCRISLLEVSWITKMAVNVGNKFELEILLPTVANQSKFKVFFIIISNR